MNPWHDIKAWKEDGIVNAIIEIPKFSCMKYEMDKETGMLKLDRALYSAVHYPGDYGFIPQTLWDDGDPVDIFIITNNPVYPSTLAEVRIIGMIDLTDEGENDAKMIGVYYSEPRYEEWVDIQDVPAHILAEIQNFFKTYKTLEGKQIENLSFLTREEAIEAIKKGELMYKKKFK